jgi:putative redox protein
MTTIEVVLLGDRTCGITHRESGAEIRTCVAPEYGGTGNAFSSTDLLAAALGSCIATNLEPVALRHSVALERIRLRVHKRLAHAPKRVESFTVEIRVDAPVAAAVLERLRRAAEHCLVHRSLSPAVAVMTKVVPAV